MQNWWQYLICIIGGYLLGNLETAIFVSRVKFHDDVRKHGSGNAGTTNMLRVFGMGAGAVTFLGDFIKGVLAVLLGRLVLGETGAYLCGVCAVLGHDYPVFFRFKGGKGVATTLAIAWMTHPLVAAIVTVVGFVIIYLSQMVSLGSMLGITLFMLVSVIADSGNTPFVVMCVILWLLIILRHHENISRILKGNENKLFQRKKR